MNMAIPDEVAPLIAKWTPSAAPTTPAPWGNGDGYSFNSLS